MSVSSRWVPPKTPVPRTEEAPDARWLDSCEGELAFFRALIDHRPIGPTKHWAMIDICGALKKASEAEYRRMPLDDPWRKYHELYTSKIIEKNFAVQAEEAEDAEPDPLNTRVDFDLPQGDYEFVTIFEHKAARSASDTSAPSSPQRDISLPPGVVVPTAETKSPRGKGAAGTKRLRHSKADEEKGASKKAAPSVPVTRGDDAGSSGTSELSELDEEEEEEEEEEEAETESAAESVGGDEYTDAPAAPSALPDTAAAIRSLPSSKRNKAQSPGPSTTKAKPRTAKARKASKKDGGR